MTHERLARIARNILRENYVSVEDQADALAAAIMTELHEQGVLL